MSDIDESITNSKIISFACDTRLYNSVSEVEDCDLLQVDLDTIYKWANANNMTFNPNKFKYVCYSFSEGSAHGNVYLCPKLNLIDKVNDNKDLGFTMSANCNFDEHINNVLKQCSRLSGWILMTFTSRDATTICLHCLNVLCYLDLTMVRNYGVLPKLNLSIRLKECKGHSLSSLLE